MSTEIKTPQAKEEIGKPPTEEKKPAPTPEELAAATNEFLDNFFPTTIKEKPKKDIASRNKEEKEEDKEDDKKEEPAKPAEDKVDEEKEEQADKNKIKPEKPKKPVKLPPEVPEIPQGKEPEPPKKEESDFELTPRHKKKLKVFERMDPNLAKRVKTYWKQQETYIDNWEKQNPGKTFNSEDDEHSDWYAKNEPQYDDDEYNDAWEAMVEEQAVKAATEKAGHTTDEKTRKSELRQKYETDEPRITNEANNSILELVQQAVPEFKALMVDPNDPNRLLLNKAVAEKMEETDLIAKEVLVEESERLRVVVQEMKRLLRHPEVYEPKMTMSVNLTTGEKLYPHKEVQEALELIEQEMLSLPAEDTVRNGKRLISNEQFNNALGQIVNNKGLEQEQKASAINNIRKHYYHLDEEDFRLGIVAIHTTRAQQKIAKLRKVAETMAAKYNGKTGKPPKEGEEEDKEKAEPKTERIKAPSAEASSEQTDMRKTASQTGHDFTKQVTSTMFPAA